MSSNNWVQLISILTSVGAIFLSNYLGRKESERKNEYQQKVDRYNNLYIPVIRFLFQQELHNMVLTNIIGGNKFEDFLEIFQRNIKYLGKKSADKYYRLIVKDGPLTKCYVDYLFQEAREGKFKSGSSYSIDPEVYKVNLMFTDFIKEFLKESVNLAEELNLEPIGQSLLDAFPNEQDHSKQHTLKEQ